jgi:hypothetical protein
MISVYFLSKSFFMNALIQSLQDKMGMTAEQAKEAANHMMDYIKEKVPASMHEHLDFAAMGETFKIKSGEYLAEAKTKSGEFLAEAKTKSGEFLADAQTKGSDFLHAAQDKINSMLHSKES